MKRSHVLTAFVAVVIAVPLTDARAQEPRVNDPTAFAIEALAGSVGSLIGIGIVAATQKCGVEDLGCVIIKVGVGGLAGAVGAVVGSHVAQHYTESRRSIPGGVAGAIVGTGVGLGVHWLLNSGSDRNLGDMVVVPIFVISQGVFSVLGSRAFGREPTHSTSR